MATAAFPHTSPQPSSPRNTLLPILWAGRFRVYVNSFREAPFVWSIDDGDANHEVKCTLVRANNVTMRTGCHSSVQPGYTPKPEDQKVAKAWLEGEASVFQLPNGEILLEPLG